MCTAAMGKLMTKSLSGRLRDKISANDPLSKALGYEGLADPVGDIAHRAAGTKSELTMKREATGLRQATAERNAAFARKQATSVSGHVASIAARKARGG